MNQSSAITSNTSILGENQTSSDDSPWWYKFKDEEFWAVVLILVFCFGTLAWSRFLDVQVNSTKDIPRMSSSLLWRLALRYLSRLTMLWTVVLGVLVFLFLPIGISLGTALVAITASFWLSCNIAIGKFHKDEQPMSLLLLECVTRYRCLELQQETTMEQVRKDWDTIQKWTAADYGAPCVSARPVRTWDPPPIEGKRHTKPCSCAPCRGIMDRIISMTRVVLCCFYLPPPRRSREKTFVVGDALWCSEFQKSGHLKRKWLQPSVLFPDPVILQVWRQRRSAYSAPNRFTRGGEHALAFMTILRALNHVHGSNIGSDSRVYNEPCRYYRNSEIETSIRAVVNIEWVARIDIINNFGSLLKEDESVPGLRSGSTAWWKVGAEIMAILHHSLGMDSVRYPETADQAATLFQILATLDGVFKAKDGTDQVARRIVSDYGPALARADSRAEDTPSETNQGSKALQASTEKVRRIHDRIGRTSSELRRQIDKVSYRSKLEGVDVELALACPEEENYRQTEDAVEAIRVALDSWLDDRGRLADTSLNEPGVRRGIQWLALGYIVQHCAHHASKQSWRLWEEIEGEMRKTAEEKEDVELREREDGSFLAWYYEKNMWPKEELEVAIVRWLVTHVLEAENYHGLIEKLRSVFPLD